MDRFGVVGINYKDLTLIEREIFIKKDPEKIAEKLKLEGLIDGYVVIITCLRIEFYFQIIKNSLIGHILRELGQNENKFYFFLGDDAIKHLFKVTCGLDSIILGEDQILSQIKKTYLSSLSENKTCPELNKIFNNAIAVGKKFRTESRISAKALSLERIAVNFIKQHFDGIENKKVFLIGTGDLSQSLLYVLKKEGIKDIIITNRSTHNSKTVEQKFQVDTVDFKKKYEVINSSDIIVSATSAPHFIIKFEDMKKHLTILKERFFLDLAVPRDIEEEIRNLEGVTLYNIDDLWETYNNNTGERSGISEKYLHLLDEQLRDCRQWYEKRNEARLV